MESRCGWVVEPWRQLAKEKDRQSWIVLVGVTDQVRRPQEKQRSQSRYYEIKLNTREQGAPGECILSSSIQIWFDSWSVGICLSLDLIFPSVFLEIRPRTFPFPVLHLQHSNKHIQPAACVPDYNIISQCQKVGHSCLFLRRRNILSGLVVNVNPISPWISLVFLILYFTCHLRK